MVSGKSFFGLKTVPLEDTNKQLNAVYVMERNRPYRLYYIWNTMIFRSEIKCLVKPIILRYTMCMVHIYFVTYSIVFVDDRLASDSSGLL